MCFIGIANAIGMVHMVRNCSVSTASLTGFIYRMHITESAIKKTSQSLHFAQNFSNAFAIYAIHTHARTHILLSRLLVDVGKINRNCFDFLGKQYKIGKHLNGEFLFLWNSRIYNKCLVTHIIKEISFCFSAEMIQLWRNDSWKLWIN